MSFTSLIKVFLSFFFYFFYMLRKTIWGRRLACGHSVLAQRQLSLLHASCYIAVTCLRNRERDSGQIQGCSYGFTLALPGAAEEGGGRGWWCDSGPHSACCQASSHRIAQIIGVPLPPLSFLSSHSACPTTILRITWNDI